MSISAQDIINIMRKRGRGDPPAALGDVFVNPLVRVLNFLNSKVDLARAEQTIDGILLLLENPDIIDQMATDLNEDSATITTRLKNALDDIGSNFGLTRRTAVGARGSVLLMRTSDPSAALPIAITAGQRVAAPSIDQEYLISSSIAIASMSFNTTYNKFVASVPIEASGVGINTNAAINEITQLKNSIRGIDSVTNTSIISGGRDAESDTDFGGRIKVALSTNNIGTESGYRNTVLQVTNVKDAVVIGAGNPLMTRDLGDGGAIDIYVTDPIPSTIVETATTSNTQNLGGGVWKFVPSRQPIVDDINTIVVTDTNPSPLPVSVIEIDKDSSVYQGSIRGADGIEFDQAPTGSGFTVQFQANNLVNEVHSYLNQPERKLLGADVLVKEAAIVGVDVVFQMSVSSGYAFASVKDQVEAAVVNQVAVLTIGQSLELSDTINIITEIPGVDRVTIPFQKFNTETETGYVNIIQPAGNEILRPNTILATQ